MIDSLLSIQFEKLSINLEDKNLWFYEFQEKIMKSEEEKVLLQKMEKYNFGED